MRSTRPAGVLCGLLFAASPACGSRTELVIQEPCAVQGEERPCRDVCGEGIKRCEDGVFGECVVPRIEQRCDNACGSGLMECVGGEWGDCVVPYVEEGCENVCGFGLRSCSDGEWSACEVPATEFPCENPCGTGTSVCEDGAMGECQVPVLAVGCSSVCGSGHETCSDGVWGPCDAPEPRPPVLTAFVRDFQIAHDDFEIPPNEIEHPSRQPETGIVEFQLGPDDKPVYAHPGSRTQTTTGEANFDQWFRDVPGVNWTEPLDLPLEPSPDVVGLFVYHDEDFFPIDDELFGNEGNSHNYHFTLEARATFQYLGGEIFNFTGDDDMWVFINRRLAIDLGGLHEPVSGSVPLDEIARTHGLHVGNIYPLHFFFAERHTIESNFNIETSIADPGSCD